jgi:L,D-transpeptidase catalytic domain/Bacterial Ig-like domain/Putative peptidoglycan binding domain
MRWYDSLPMKGRRLRRFFSNRRLATGAIAVTAFALVAASTALLLERVTPSRAAASSANRSPAPALELVSSNPAPGATGVAPDTPLSLTFSAPLAASETQPTLVPPVPGTWVRTSRDVLTFDAAASLPPGTAEQLSVPGGHQGMEGADGQYLRTTNTIRFTVAPMSELRLQQLLSQLGFMPLSFTPSNPAPVAVDEVGMPQAGTFAWRWSTLPANFTSLWSEGQANAVTTGAVMAFESQHGLATDGVAGPQVWAALLAAAAANQGDTAGHYNFVEVSTAIPESVDVWSDGAMVYSSPANTGIEAAPTEVGTWPVYARYTSTTMSGTNPDGSHYDDPGVPWVSYFHGGDALHGFVRSSYGTPQSLGCVEMPPTNAAVVFPYTPLGTLVTVS